MIEMHRWPTDMNKIIRNYRPQFSSIISSTPCTYHLLPSSLNMTPLQVTRCPYCLWYFNKAIVTAKLAESRNIKGSTASRAYFHTCTGFRYSYYLFFYKLCWEKRLVIVTCWLRAFQHTVCADFSIYIDSSHWWTTRCVLFAETWLYGRCSSLILVSTLYWDGADKLCPWVQLWRSEDTDGVLSSTFVTDRDIGSKRFIIHRLKWKYVFWLLLFVE